MKKGSPDQRKTKAIAWEYVCYVLRKKGNLWSWSIVNNKEGDIEFGGEKTIGSRRLK